MSKGRAHSSPDLSLFPRPDDSTLEGVATNVKLLLKLIQDHNDASNKDSDSRRPQRAATMINIINEVKSRIEKSQKSEQRTKREAEFRRCNTEIRRNNVPVVNKPQIATEEENEKLSRELASSTAARKSLEKMFFILGKEKAIMTGELARNVQEMKEMEEHLSDFKAQNEKLLSKVQAGAAEHRERMIGNRGMGDIQGNMVLQERNKVLSEQLSKTLDGYRGLKRKLKVVQEENATMRMKMEQVADEVAAGLQRIYDLQERNTLDMEEELSVVEHMFRSFQAKLMICSPKREECVRPNGSLPAEKCPVLV